MRLTRVLIVADIEGSSGCRSYRASSFMTPEWRRACLEMTRDVAAVVGSLFRAGASRVQVNDFHRTGYNLLPEKIDGCPIACAQAEAMIPGIQTFSIPKAADPKE